MFLWEVVTVNYFFVQDYFLYTFIKINIAYHSSDNHIGQQQVKRHQRGIAVYHTHWYAEDLIH